MGRTRRTSSLAAWPWWVLQLKRRKAILVYTLGRFTRILSNTENTPMYVPGHTQHTFQIRGSIQNSRSIMGASESSFWPPQPQQQKIDSPSEEDRSNEAATMPSDYDPRSPNSAIQRTPIRMKVADQVPADPRSPSSDFQRTPLRNVQEKNSRNLAHALFTEKEEQQRKPSSTSS